MHSNADVIDGFYAAFQRGDYEHMGAAYADDARFHDPAFPDLDADSVRAMWRMLIQRGKDLELTYSGVRAGDTEASARWEATYTFGKTGRKVHNVIDASFRLRDGKIVEHTDRFDMWRWTRMALGPTGLLLGWTPMVKGKVRATAASQLAAFMASH